MLQDAPDTNAPERLFSEKVGLSVTNRVAIASYVCEQTHRNREMTLQEFKDSVLPWQRMMYSVAIRIGLTADDAADAVQEAVIHLWRSRERLAGVDDLKPYCLKTLRNVCISQLRGRHAMAPVEALESVAVDDFTTQKMDCSPERVRALLDRLPESWRTVVRMRCLAGMEYAEIAAATGYSQSNVRQMLSRARKELRKYFE